MSDEVNPQVSMNSDSTTIIIDSVYQLKLTPKYNIEMLTKKQPNTAVIRIHLKERVALYTSDGDGSELKNNGYYDLGYAFRDSIFPCFALFEDKTINGEHHYIGLDNHPLRQTFTEKQLDHLRIAIDKDFKTQIKPIEYGDLTDYINWIELYVKDDKDENIYKITENDGKPYYLLMNGIFRDEIYK